MQSTSSRAKVFRPSESGLWQQKSMKMEYEAMLECAMDQKMELDASEQSFDDNTVSKFHCDVNVPDLEFTSNSIVTLLNEFDSNQTPGVSDIKNELNRAFIAKVQTLHDKISAHVSCIATELQKNHNNTLKERYQTAYDFLADVQDELMVFQDDIAQNEKRVNYMEQNIANLQHQYEKAMMKLKNATAKQNDLRKRNTELSNLNLKLSTKNVSKDTEDTKDEVIEQSWNMNSKFLLIWFMLWMIGAVFRYFILFPLQILILMNMMLFSVVQFWFWERVFPNDPQTLELQKLWSLQLLVQILLRYGVINDEYTDIVAPQKGEEMYTVSLCYPYTQKRVYSWVMRDLKISFALFG